METKALKDFETFSDFPEKYLQITSTSGYYYIKNDEGNFIAKENIDLVSIINFDNKVKIISSKSYYDVTNGNLVLRNKYVTNIDATGEKTIKLDCNTKIISLSSILNIKGNGVYYLSKDDINTFINYKEECAKTYGMEPRKYYF